MGDRTPCSVPGCRRTAPRTSEDEEIVCGKHVRGVSLATRRRLRALQRRFQAFVDAHPDPRVLGPEEMARGWRYHRAAALAWRVFVAQAVRAAAGI